MTEYFSGIFPKFMKVCEFFVKKKNLEHYLGSPALFLSTAINIHNGTAKNLMGLRERG